LIGSSAERGNALEKTAVHPNWINTDSVHCHSA
jgi:hypothetical protein